MLDCFWNRLKGFWAFWIFNGTRGGETSKKNIYERATYWDKLVHTRVYGNQKHKLNIVIQPGYHAKKRCDLHEINLETANPKQMKTILQSLWE